ncbi:hypothetical protein CBM2587_B90692 [Cupriavidus taiwanensis]|uniref:Uncharacterized protein n=1 Tax=Cupriavidus taiwanensis TaxID=164546 RepID=A0A375CDT2_9BURK|nr:hypothetical protein CBM2587_B90692 [Cupriavidus taiwanensis]
MEADVQPNPVSAAPQAYACPLVVRQLLLGSLSF